MSLHLIFVLTVNLIIVQSEIITKPIDLTWSFENSSIYWPGSRNFEFISQVGKYLDTSEKFWYAINEFCAGEHGGTHLDAPYHFYKDGKKVGEIPLEKLIANGAIIDISNEVEAEGPTRNLQESDLVNWEKKNGPFEANTVLLVKFGWSKFYKDKATYLGLNKEGKLVFPGISPSAARWIASSGKIVGVGLDVASVDPGSNTNFESHRILAAADIYNLENVKLVDKLPDRNFKLIVMPMKIELGTGAPLRLIALNNL